MEIEYDHKAERVKIADYPFGAVFSFEGRIYMKVGASGCNSTRAPDYGFLCLETGLKVSNEIHREIDYGSVKILDAKLVIKEVV